MPFVGRTVLARDSPFFGTACEAAAYIHLHREVGHEAPGGFGRIVALCADRLGYSNLNIKWWVGVAAHYFDDIGASLRPRLLTPLQFNGDTCENGKEKYEKAALGIVLGGSWTQVVRGASGLAKDVIAEGFRADQVDIGQNCPGLRGHSGFVDGVSNLQELDPASFSLCTFVQPEDDAAFNGGSYLTIRKYEEDLDAWHDLPDVVQEQIIGRKKERNLFLSGEAEWSPSAWNFTPTRAHIRLANPRLIPGSANWSDRVYRRSIPYTETDASGRMRCGLLFVALNRDPHRQIERIHNERLLPVEGERDLLLSSGYVTVISTAMYFLPPCLTQHSIP